MESRLTVVLASLLLATPAVIFWLWLVILPARVAVLCPEECWCDPGGYYVDCSNSSLNSIPLIFPTDVQALVLNENIIKSLEKNSFISRGLTELDLLDISDCGLETLELGAFSGLSKLRKLLMWYNELSEITQRTFENMGHLEYLDLDGNRIGHLEVGAFSKLINLKYLYLRTNELQYLHPNMFAGLPSLYELNLDDNPNLIIPPDRPFISSHSLAYLGISSCSVSSVSAETFANVTALHMLDLSHNNLPSVDIDILKVLPELSALYLYGNPLQCDCQLQEVWRWCQDHNIETAYEGKAPECDTPSELRGKYWGVVETAQCLQDTVTYSGDYDKTTYSYSTTDNMSHKKDAENLSEKYGIAIYAVLCTFGTAGNVILIIIIIHNKDMRTVPNMYILNLAVSDMIYLIVHFFDPDLNVEVSKLFYGDILTYVTFFRRLSVGLSAYSVAVLSIQRYRVTVNSFHVHISSHRAWSGIIGTVVGVWIVAALFAIPSAIAEKHDSEYEYIIPYYKEVVVFELLVSSALPLCVIAFSYTMMACHVLKSFDPISQHSESPHLNTRKRTAKTVLGLTFVFLISNVPYHVLWAYLTHIAKWYAYKSEIDDSSTVEFKYLYIVSKCLLLINSCFNPVALFCTSRAFKGHLKRYLTCSCKANSPVSNL